MPRLAGEPVLSVAPLYHWLAATLGNLAEWLWGRSAWVPGARLTTALFSLQGLFAISLAARGFYGREAGLIAPLLAIGTLGLLIPAHEAQPAMIAFAAVATLLAALAWWEVRPRQAAIGLGLSLGLGFLGDGLSILAIGLPVVASAMFYSRWRKIAKAEWLLALLIAAVLILSWPVAVGQHYPAHFAAWWQHELASVGFPPAPDSRRLQLFAWGTWPVLPLAGWSIWLNRKRIFSGRIFLPALASVISLALLLRVRDPGEGVVPAIAALAILASAGAGQLRRGAASAFDWFGAMSLSFFMSLILLAGYAIQTGSPARIAKNFTKPAPGFVADLPWHLGIVVVAVVLIWVVMLVRLQRTPWRASIRWSLGIVITWLLIVSLLLPWIDYGKSHRQPSAAIKAVLISEGAAVNCIERDNLGMAQRAALDLHDGIRTVLIKGDSSCNYRLTQREPNERFQVPGWTLLLETSRPGDKSERLRLYRRGIAMKDGA